MFAAKGIHVSRFLSLVLDCLSRSLVKQAKLAHINYQYVFAAGDGEMLADIAQLCEQEVIKPVVDKVYPFEKADGAIEYLEAGHATGKVVVELIAENHSV